MKRLVVFVVVSLVSFVPIAAHAYDDGDGGNGSGDDCYHGGCGNYHRHDGDNIHLPDFNNSPVGPVYICVQPGSCNFNSPTTTSTRPNHTVSCQVPVPWHCDPRPKRTQESVTRP